MFLENGKNYGSPAGEIKDKKVCRESGLYLDAVPLIFRSLYPDKQTLGTPLHDMGKGPAAMAITVITNPGPDIDPLAPDFNAAKNLSNKIPGFMPRSIPGRLWIRISHSLMNKKFTLESLGQCLIFAYRDSFPGISGITVFIVAERPDMIRAIESIHKRAAVIREENTRLQLEADGTLSCPDLDCTVCDDRPVCDTIRDVIRKKRRI
jgi:CO dehydrogenase/acetyl-CoA synthase beta subunit